MCGCCCCCVRLSKSDWVACPYKRICFKMSSFLIFFFVCPLFICSCCGFHLKWWHKHSTRREQMEKAVDKCCPRDYTNNAEFCCANNLFDEDAEVPLKECQEEGMPMSTIFRTVRCAQREFHGSTDICRFFCCDFLKNVQGASKETNWSINCTSAAFTVGMTAKKQMRRLKRMGSDTEAPLQFNAFKECMHMPERFVDDTDDSKADSDDEKEKNKMLLREVCRGENGE
uniref:Uncharacterized protein n=1 Tax=Globodera rostochiensis TaxID=31243 RepID=A0A914H075_GLORO